MARKVLQRHVPPIPAAPCMARKVLQRCVPPTQHEAFVSRHGGRLLMLITWSAGTAADHWCSSLRQQALRQTTDAHHFVSRHCGRPLMLIILLRRCLVAEQSEYVVLFRKIKFSEYVKYYGRVPWILQYGIIFTSWTKKKCCLNEK